MTKFKKGFGGNEINYLGTYDLIYNKFLYIIYILLRKIKRICVMDDVLKIRDLVYQETGM